MVLLPDYPEKTFLAHRLRVERLALLCTLVLIGGGAWWLAPAVTSGAEMFPKVGPVLVLFASALLLPDLIDYGPVERSRLGTAANIAWPSVLALAGIHYGQGDELIASLMLAAIAAFLWRYTSHLLGGSLGIRKWRGLTSIAGLAIAISILVSMSGDTVLWAVVITASLVTMVPDLRAKDDNHGARAEFASRLEQVETRILSLREGGSGLEQSASLLKTAREEGYKDPSRGMGLITQAEIEMERTQAVAVDLDAIRSDALKAVKRAEEVTLDALGPRKAFEAGDREAKLGSPREAELLYRRAKEKAALIEEHWQRAADAIAESVAAIGDHTGHQADAVRDILRAAEEALQAEEPKEALHIASSIPEHLESLGSSGEAAAKSLSDAEHAVTAAEDDIQIVTKARLEQARKAIDSGDFALAKGLADSVLRDVRETSDAMQEVQRALRQSKQITAGFPSGTAAEEWEVRLKQVDASAEAGEWTSAAEELRSLAADLQALQVQMSEAEELLAFVEQEWMSLRRRLDSSSIGPADQTRMETEGAVKSAREALKEGEMSTCLSALGRADALIENLRRRV